MVVSLMKTLHRLGWPLLILGLVVVLVAILSMVVLDEELQQQSFVAETRYKFLTAAEIEKRRAHLSTLPALLVGSGLTAVGIVLPEIRRRLANR